jgi:hypothetical protein
MHGRDENARRISVRKAARKRLLGKTSIKIICGAVDLTHGAVEQLCEPGMGSLDCC